MCRRSPGRLRSKNSDVAGKAEPAYVKALSLLARRDYSVAALTRKLAMRGHDGGDIDEALNRLQLEGLLNDRRYAERFAEQSLSGGRYTGFRLRLELMKRGIAEELVSEVMEQFSWQHDRREMCGQLLVKKFSSLDFKTINDSDKRRICDFMRRRGISLSVVLDCLRNTRIDFDTGAANDR